MTWADVLPPGTGSPLSLLLSSSPLWLLWLLLLMMRRDQRPRSQLIAVRLLQVFTKYFGCHPILKGPKPEGHHVTNHDESPKPSIFQQSQTWGHRLLWKDRVQFSKYKIGESASKRGIG